MQEFRSREGFPRYTLIRSVMRLLHLSDIHFREPECLNADTDSNLPYRTVLERDVVAQCVNDGRAVGAILVGGDIAYKAHPHEYGKAQDWLLRLAESCNCPPERIYVVPGNHDVNRKVCGESMAVANAQEAVVAAKGGEAVRERALRKQLGDVDTGRALFQPLAAYNDFAAAFGCNVFPSQPFWKDTIDLTQGVKLRLFGLTSTLLSGIGERDNEPGQLYLSPLQTVLNLEDDVVNLVICHHPPVWLLDRSEVEDKINTRAMLQFFGHEHKQRCLRDPAFMRFLAGAVNPDKMEPDWRPGYNLVDLDIVGKGEDRSLNVRALVRQHQPVPEMFIPQMAGPNTSEWLHSISFPQRRVFVPTQYKSPVEPPQLHTKIADAVHQATVEVATESVKTEATMSDPSTRRLVFRFWGLTIGERRNIVMKLGLLSQEDFASPEPDHERYTKALREAANRGLLADLASEIEAIENKL